ncbi:MAG: S41 family peptidase [Pseudomonadota bacterium]
MTYIAKFMFVLSFIIVSTNSIAETLSPAKKRALIDKMADLIKQRYVYPEHGQALANKLLQDLDDGAFNSIQQKQMFADFFTDYLRSETRDGHLALDYKPKRQSQHNQDQEKSSEAHVGDEMEKWYGAHINHGFNAITRLENNIGVLDLRVFAPPEMAADLAHAAMILSAQFDALIVDLRKNGGGMGEQAHIMINYLLDKPSMPLSGIYNRPSDTHTTFSTAETLPQRRFGGQKPLFVLTSKRTFSAAEAFAYDLQALGRATIVGEQSGGGAHPFEYRALDDEFFLSLAESRSINPITGTNWQGVGVQPDIAVSSDKAMQRALKLAKQALAAQSREENEGTSVR